MAAEVSSSSLVRVLSGRIEEQPHSGNSDILITKDLLGSLSKSASTKEIDLEFKSQNWSSPKSPLSSAAAAAAPNSSPAGNKKKQLPNSIEVSKLQDLNLPPINLFEDMTNSLDFKLQYFSTPSSYQSVCTLDKVKHALERAEKGTLKKRSPSPPPPSSATEAAATSLPSTPGMFAAACPGCLLYVMASNANPRCPRCNSIVPSAMALKKPRIDLNASF
ncbi:hypothetical protein PTKIN_Ptkin18bG0087800 [Pterospermum kingtungense]